jgi:hypothetical protein
MTHIQIHMAMGEVEVLVDGFDLTPHILAEGFAVEMGDVFHKPSKVDLVRVAKTLDVDLPEGILKAVRQDESA